MYFYKSEKYGFSSVPDGLPNRGEVFVDHSRSGRGGHLGHAMVEYAPGCILCFYSSCNDECTFGTEENDFTGHSARGWMEYKRSTDGGATWSEGKPFEYSKQLFDSKAGVAAFCEKAVLADDGAIVVFNLLSDIRRDCMWEPYLPPTAMRSTDGGETWEKPVSVCGRNARVFDVIKRGGRIYALAEELESKVFYEALPLGYFMYVSDDNGRSFTELSRLPLTLYKDCLYGAMEFLDGGGLIVYTYTPDRENYMRYVISRDGGATWCDAKISRFEKQLRNPQMIKFKDTYFMFGRSGIYGADEEKGQNVLYCSADGINWDSGRFICLKEVGFTTAFYSNAITVGAHGGEDEYILYQYSMAYRRSLTNVMHRKITAEELKNV